MSRFVGTRRNTSRIVEKCRDCKNVAEKKETAFSGRKAEKRIHKRAKSVFWGRTQDPPVWE